MASITREEFETVKELLGSAARYAESANRGVERLQMAQENAQVQIGLLAQSQRLAEQRIEALAAQAQKTEQRLESFIHESQRLLTGQAERLAQLEVIADRLAGVLSYLTRKSDQREGGGNN